MKKIEVRDQVPLPLRRCLRLTIQGIRYRLFRSAITVVIVSLAVAFLMMMLSTSYIDKEVAADAQDRTADRRLLTEWADKLTVPMAGELLTDRLAVVEEDTPAWRELMGWGGLATEQLAELKSLAVRQGEYFMYFDKLDPEQRRELVDTREGEVALTFLAEKGELDEFVKKSREYRGRTFPGEDAKEGKKDRKVWLTELIDGVVATKAQRAKIAAAHAAAVNGLAKDLGERTYLDLFGRSDDGQVDPVAIVNKHGFELATEQLGTLREQAHLALDARIISGLLRDQNMRSYIADEAGVEVQQVTPKQVFKSAASGRRARRLLEEIEKTRASAQGKIDALQAEKKGLDALLATRAAEIVRVAVDHKKDASSHPETAGLLLELVGHDSIRRAIGNRLKKNLALVVPEDALEVAATAEGAAWLLEQTRLAARRIPAEITDRRQRMLVPMALSAERIAEVSSAWLEQERLSSVLSGLQGTGDNAWLGFDERTAWLIVISFMVCVVGVANAMLMSVTERFREIATMKCLGALDSFIMIIFVMESSLQGVAGGIIGVLIGALLGTVRSTWNFGLLAVTNLPGAILLGSAGACLVAGVVLAALAAVYPAWVAARLAPMEAMRIE